MCPEDIFGNTSTSMCKPWSVIIAHLSRVTSVCKTLVYCLLCLSGHLQTSDVADTAPWYCDCPDRTTMNT